MTTIRTWMPRNCLHYAKTGQLHTGTFSEVANDVREYFGIAGYQGRVRARQQKGDTTRLQHRKVARPHDHATFRNVYLSTSKHVTLHTSGKAKLFTFRDVKQPVIEHAQLSGSKPVNLFNVRNKTGTRSLNSMASRPSRGRRGMLWSSLTRCPPSKFRLERCLPLS